MFVLDLRGISTQTRMSAYLCLKRLGMLGGGGAEERKGGVERGEKE